MNTAVINVRTSESVKKQAMVIAQELGFSLSALVNAYLKQLVKTKTVHHTLVEEKPNMYLQGLIRQAEKEYLNGKTIAMSSPDDIDRLVESL